MAKALQRKIEDATVRKSIPRWSRSTKSTRGSSARKSSQASLTVNGDARSSSLADKAYNLIKHEIITCALKPGEYINESQLCERLRIGRTPVHEAIGQLQQERFLDIIPRKGIIVRPISLDEYFSLDETRLLLEVGAMRLAAERVTKFELEQLDSILQQARAARRARNIEQLLLSDRDFHFVLAESTHNPVLSSMLKAAYERSLRVWFVSSANLFIEDSREEHEGIVAALRRKDGEKASEVMREHILSSRAHTMRAD